MGQLLPWELRVWEVLGGKPWMEKEIGVMLVSHQLLFWVG